jgi:BMFP domain-containing protein YqiC
MRGHDQPSAFAHNSIEANMRDPSLLSRAQWSALNTSKSTLVVIARASPVQGDCATALSEINSRVEQQVRAQLAKPVKVVDVVDERHFHQRNVARKAS